ncbi:probable Imidazole glycerol phosphate synthase hisHF [Saccharomycodes ludwigii]|uniref:Imidazole glycerol phosphate synthase hisHF n=1 Tax=Saccharomycodes ludwigii TaxID=36035 RepID=A0A376B6B5_9ASCO|nr:hypothetical protein SCDLUD_001046 [Saccharomycodes ludwigii]KAH3903410.1 hypothetical protein SCDLUD_001046 [Saccharomycodes ludwigii]SSD60109.1 probable Imidazole glycerol phosphate synthase hisHF [Saccharomycodes ludwigii]
MSSSNIVYVIDVGSGNLRSLINGITYLGFQTKLITNPADLPEPSASTNLILPGVGNFGHFVDNLYSKGFEKPLKNYIASNGKIMGICVGLQTFFKTSEESPTSKGLNLIENFNLSKFDDSDKPVPEIGWNSVYSDSALFYNLDPYKRYYFVHSYAGILKQDDEATKKALKDWNIAKCKYGNQEFIAAIMKGNIFATQFHPEKSGLAGLQVIKSFLLGDSSPADLSHYTDIQKAQLSNDYSNFGLTRRIIACLDVRSNDQGDLVVTKGDQYDVREKIGGNNVRNLGKPVELAEKYYKQGADEVTFLNITSFRNCPVKDTPMLTVLSKAAETCFVPLTVGGGIKDVLDVDGTLIPADEVAALYFRSGADKVSIGTDAVYAAEKFYANGMKGDGTSPIETISKKFGAQAVVISVDPKRVYIKTLDEVAPNKNAIKTKFKGPMGEEYCWYQCTIKGGRETRDLSVYELTRACEKLGAGEILLNCIDKDGSNSGYDLELIKHVKSAVKIPVIASSGAGNPQHFEEAFEETNCDACLGAGIFHRGEYTVNDIKKYLLSKGLKVRMDIQ